MRKQFLIFIAFMLLGSCRSIKKHNEQITKLHAVEDLKRDINLVYNQLKKNHPKLYQYTTKQVLDFKFDSLKTTIITPITSRAFYKKVSPVVAEIKQGHISVGSVNKRYTRKERKYLKEHKFEFYDLDFEYLDTKLWVVGNRGKDSTIIGDEVFKIENELASDLIENFKTRFASDGYNQTLYNRAVGKNFSTFYFKDKGFLDSLKIVFKRKDSLYFKAFYHILKEEKAIKNDSIKPKTPVKLIKLEKRENRLKAKRMRKEDRKRGFIPFKKEYTRNFDFIGKDSSVAYMNLRSFSNGNYKKFYKEVFEELDSLKTETLILDLRDNGGGRIAEIDYLYSFLTNENYKFIEPSEVCSRFSYFNSLMSNTSPFLIKASAIVFSPLIVAQNVLKTKKRDGVIYYNMRFSKEKKPNKLNYKGQLYVITNGNSFSASSLLSTHLQANSRAVFIGEETGGAYNGCVAGIYKIYKMPTSKLNIRMGLMQVEAPYKQMPDGFGVKPDVDIIPTIKDRNLNSDPEIEWILNTIELGKNITN